MKQNSNVMEKNPVMRTAKRAMSLMKNKLIASLILLVQGILFIVSPAENMQMTVRIIKKNAAEAGSVTEAQLKEAHQLFREWLDAIGEPDRSEIMQTLEEIENSEC